MNTTIHRSRRSVRRLVPSVCLVVLAAASAFVAAPASAATTDPVDVTAGALDWGVKAGFRNYVTGPIAHGSITTADGATTNPDGTFHFPVREGGSYDQDDGVLTTSYDGTVRFTGHDGKLDFQVGELRVNFVGAVGTLVADVSSIPFDPSTEETPAPVVYDDVELATLAPTAVAPVASGVSDITWTGVPAVLTEAGVAAFAEFYGAGAALDPLTVALTLAEPPVIEPPAPVTATVSATSVPVGGSMTVSGGGFVAGEQVEVWVLSDPVWVGTTTADGSGRVTFSFTVPAVAPGEHRAELRGITSARVLASDVFTVTAVEVAGAGTGDPTGPAGATGTTTSVAGGTLPATGASTLLTVLGALVLGAGLVLRRVSRVGRSGRRAGITV